MAVRGADESTTTQGPEHKSNPAKLEVGAAYKSSMGCGGFCVFGGIGVEGVGVLQNWQVPLKEEFLGKSYCKFVTVDVEVHKLEEALSNVTH